MRSTGEVMGVADNFGEAFAKAQIAAGQKLPTQGTVFISVTDHDKPGVVELARRFVDMGFKLVATHGTADRLEEAGLVVDRVYKVKEGRPNAVDLIKAERIQLNRQYAPRPRSLLRRKSHPPRRSYRPHSDDHDAERRQSRRRRHRRPPAGRNPRASPANTPRRETRNQKLD